LKLAWHVESPAFAAEIWDSCTMLVLVPSATHIWKRVIPGGGVHCHWKEPSLATVQERLAADTTLSGPGGTAGSTEDCRNVIVVVGRATNERGKPHVTTTTVQVGLGTAACQHTSCIVCRASQGMGLGMSLVY